MNFKKNLAVFLIIIILLSAISNIVYALEIENNTVTNEKLINNTSIKENETNTNTTEKNQNLIEQNSNISENKNKSQNLIDQNATVKEKTIENDKKSNIKLEENKKTDFDDNNKVSAKFKELLELQNIKDVNNLSSRITEQQMKPILEQNIENINMLMQINSESYNSNIWIEEKSRNIIKDLLNNHGSYTYTINGKGYVNFDKTLRKNENLDLETLQETEVDITINNVMNEEKEIIIKISDIYYKFDEDNNIISVNFDKEIKSKAYEYNGIRVILLNSQYYNSKNISYNLPLSDDFIKILDNIQYKVLTGEITLGKEMISKSEGISPLFTDNGQVIGAALKDQIVYHGPNDNGTYSTVGSISKTEPVAILGSEGEYYHILYAVTGTYKEKTGYVFKSNIAKIGAVTEEIMTGGYRYANSGQNIQSRGLYKVAVSYGSVSATEGVTLLYDYYMNYEDHQYQVGFIEYWTATGMKRGYIKMQYLTNPFSSALLKASGKKVTYTGPNSSRFTSGTGAIGANEYVCALGYTNDYIFIEYNTTTGRKRAFCNKNDLRISNPGNLGITKLPTIQMTQGYISSKKQNVSAGPGIPVTTDTPSGLCSYVGAIGQTESVYRQLANGNNPYNQLGYTYIVYYAGNSLKGGFIPDRILTKGNNPSIPDPPSNIGKEGAFQTSYYWQSGLGGPINSYKIGTGEKRLYLVYAQHGFEDEGYGDGIELVDIAYRFMDFMYNNRNDSNIQKILSNWTIYLIPYLNRDGITSGSTENGPGRCNVKNEIDINRNWPTKIYVQNLNKGRNYTGEYKLGTVEAQGLNTMLKKEEVNPIDGKTSILIDIHGWDCETIGDIGIGNYYYNQFKNDNETRFVSHSGTHPFQCRQLYSNKNSSGYLAQWAVEDGGVDKSIILELPSHNNRQIGSRSLSDRFNTATINLLLGE